MSGTYSSVVDLRGKQGLVDSCADKQLNEYQVSVTIVHTCTIVLTSWRLWYKIVQQCWWWEDVWAAIALAAIITSEVSVWIFSETPMGSKPWNGSIIAYWLLMINFTIGLWSSRLSMICSIVRLSSPTRIRTIARWAAAAFGATTIVLLVHKCWFCARYHDWEEIAPLSCSLASSVAITQVIADFLSDMTLVVLPAQILHRVKLPRNQKILILSVFSGSLITTLLSIVHAVFFVQADPILKILTAQLEMAFSVIICNLLPIITCLYKVFRKDLDLSHRRYSAGSMFFTTIVEMPSLDSHASEELKFIA
ncbi:hypothetical protein DFJ58DRAFT_712386 [Suillus subalutaceus]|uniref:uncharacterized protein n=1 Tax=Suillus subalutaceus TaxID=48586 RepID=UPI001B86BDF6|nr:uncharacterized protein DFJ58DRAFT_712386 [Suillus subalutaceus]KAG1877689.1 hypothetical protein DFJ58DRAFT_712386 [Suillus subalutaceus]